MNNSITHLESAVGVAAAVASYEYYAYANPHTMIALTILAFLSGYFGKKFMAQAQALTAAAPVK